MGKQKGTGNENYTTSKCLWRNIFNTNRAMAQPYYECHDWSHFPFEDAREQEELTLFQTQERLNTSLGPVALTDLILKHLCFST